MDEVKGFKKKLMVRNNTVLKLTYRKIGLARLLKFWRKWKGKHQGFLLFDILLNKHLGTTLATLLFVIVLNFSIFFTSPSSNLQIKFYDVGEGESILIRTPAGYKVLIDGGPDNRVVQHLGKDLPFYDRGLDLVILTHPHADHLAGLIEVLRRYQVKQVWTNGASSSTSLYDSWVETLGKEGSKVDYPKKGSSMDFGDGVVIEVLHPSGLGEGGEDPNDYSIVVLLTYGRFSSLLTGDAGGEVQPYYNDSVTVLKVPHQGADTALKEDFLRVIVPQVSIISLGEKNVYNHPSERIAALLKSVGSVVYRTDEHGTVEVVTDGTTWYTKTGR
jgi:competence protein ComEC